MEIIMPNKTNKKYTIEEIEKDLICRQWIYYGLIEQSEKTNDFFQEKQNFWEENKKHLQKYGFRYSSNIMSALDEISSQSESDLEGSLLIVKVGNDRYPASAQDIAMAQDMIENVLDGIKGVRVLITPHSFDITKISLPQLRCMQSAILTSFEKQNVNPISTLEF